jgi:RNA polymerase sigma factor (sigma-70 family)
MGMQTDIQEQVALHRAGDQAATEVLAGRALTLALRTAAAVLRSREEAADVAQDVAVEAIRKVGSLRDPAVFDAWVHRITVRETMRVMRKRSTRRSREEPLDQREHIQPEAPSDPRGAVLESALSSLPQRQQIALALRYVHDLSDDEIAAALGCRPGTAASLLSRGREVLRHHPLLQDMARTQPGGGY